jgi:hypothetical protein
MFPDTMEKKLVVDHSSTKPVVDLSSTKPMVDLSYTDQQVEEKTMHKPTATTKGLRAPATCTGQKRKRVNMSPDEVLVMTNMIDVMNNVANALRVTRPGQVHPNLYHVVMRTWVL